MSSSNTLLVSYKRGLKILGHNEQDAVSPAFKSTYIAKIIDRNWIERVDRGLSVGWGHRRFGWRRGRFVGSGNHDGSNTTGEILEEDGSFKRIPLRLAYFNGGGTWVYIQPVGFEWRWEFWIYRGIP